MEYIELKGMLFDAFVGHYEEEKQIGNKFRIDLKIETNIKKAGETDKLKNALNYVKVYSVIKKEMQVKCNLVENIVERIIYKLFKNFKKIESINLKVTKISPQIGGIVEEVSIIKKIKRKNFII